MSNYCHHYLLDESASPYSDTISSRIASSIGIVNSVPGLNGSIAAIDTLGTGAVATQFSGFISPKNASNLPSTNTGLCNISGEGRLALINFDNSRLIEIDILTGLEITSFPLTGGPALPQGVALTPTNEYVIAGASVSGLWRYTRSGVFIGTLPTGLTNSVASDSLGYLWQRGTAGQVRKIHPTTGSTLAAITFVGMASGKIMDGLTIDPITNDFLFTEQNTRNIWRVASTGETIKKIPGVWDQEHLAIGDDGALWVNSDARYHSSSASGENVIYKLTQAGQPFAWSCPVGSFTINWRMKAKNISVVSVIIAFWSAVKVGGLFAELVIRPGGILRFVRPDKPGLDPVDTPGGTIVLNEIADWSYVYDAVANTITLFKGAVQVSQATGVLPLAIGADGKLSVGGRWNGTPYYANAVFDNIELIGDIPPPPPPSPYSVYIDGTLDGGLTWTELDTISIPADYPLDGLRIRSAS